jgi:hypothetical protein
VTVIVRMLAGAVYAVKGDYWTEPPANPENGGSLYVVVYSGDRKVASFNPTEVLTVYDTDSLDLEED